MRWLLSRRSLARAALVAFVAGVGAGAGGTYLVRELPTRDSPEGPTPLVAVLSNEHMDPPADLSVRVYNTGRTPVEIRGVTLAVPGEAQAQTGSTIALPAGASAVLPIITGRTDCSDLPDEGDLSISLRVAQGIAAREVTLAVRDPSRSLMVIPTSGCDAVFYPERFISVGFGDMYIDTDNNIVQTWLRVSSHASAPVEITSTALSVAAELPATVPPRGSIGLRVEGTLTEFCAFVESQTKTILTSAYRHRTAEIGVAAADSGVLLSPPCEPS